ncbi:MAG: bifunctional phosphoribosylaminoimidazolecarboxamide formyltransferase/IMP cyclohydrolase [Chitinophagales bacterium]|nr:bifunctional phosphoribosylaminoimidazolecarboxamide formyltransferase/IMP cyclohydrolase [Chitinophagales bacterium]MDW8393189.1 bifunctional phosphoribosylaminoimidazolecarboxamide formyltransferase/IMP cyclohydrolase [Chitinophagales bacterium]
MNLRTVRTALISVYEKEGLEPLARLLHEFGVRLISTGGTEKHLRQLGLPVTTVESLTGFPELLDGRVKTLHPAVFAALLSRRTPEDAEQLQRRGIEPIDLVVVDLYPFERSFQADALLHEALELIDIGGVALLRAAAKNFPEVLLCPSRQHYEPVRKLLQEGKGQSTLDQRRQLASEGFALTAHYDSLIASYLNRQVQHASEPFSPSGSMPLRYGENPHQEATYSGELSGWLRQLAGKMLSYNNLLDVDAALALISEFSEPTCAIVKHTNPCGCASADEVSEAFRRAYAADPQSAFGGIIIVNREVTQALAESLQGLFFEILIAPSFSEQALARFRQSQRILLQQTAPYVAEVQQSRTVLGGILKQDYDNKCSDPERWQFVTDRRPDARQTVDLLFAEKCAKHLKSNAIALVRNSQMVGMGCGQPSRIEAVHQAVMRAERNGLSAADAVMASDAFFPFPDSVEVAAAAGVRAILQPGGSRRDAEVIAACNRLGVAMVFTGLRHFRH